MYRRSHEHFRTIRAADDAYFAAHKNETIRLPFLDQTQPDNSDLFWHLAKPAAMFSTAAVIATFASIALEAPRPAAAQGPTTESATNPNVTKFTFGELLKGDNAGANDLQNAVRAVFGITLPQGTWLQNFWTHINDRSTKQNCLKHPVELIEQTLSLVLNTPTGDALTSLGWKIFLRPGTTGDFLYFHQIDQTTAEYFYTNPNSSRLGGNGTYFLGPAPENYSKMPKQPPLSGEALDKAHTTVQDRIKGTGVDQNCRGDGSSPATAPATVPNMGGDLAKIVAIAAGLAGLVGLGTRKRPGFAS